MRNLADSFSFILHLKTLRPLTSLLRRAAARHPLSSPGICTSLAPNPSPQCRSSPESIVVIPCAAVDARLGVDEIRMAGGLSTRQVGHVALDEALQPRIEGHPIVVKHQRATNREHLVRVLRAIVCHPDGLRAEARSRLDVSHGATARAASAAPGLRTPNLLSHIGERARRTAHHAALLHDLQWQPPRRAERSQQKRPSLK